MDGRPGEATAPRIHPTADVSPAATIGAGSVVWANVQIREYVTIGAQCILGRHVFVDVGVTIGDRVKVQNNAALYEGVSLGDGVFVGPHVVFTNDRLPRAVTPGGRLKDPTDWTLGRTHVARGASIGACAVVVTGIRIGEWAMVGSGAVVTRDVDDHALVVGNPARVIGYVSASGVRCASSEEAARLSESERDAEVAE